MLANPTSLPVAACALTLAICALIGLLRTNARANIDLEYVDGVYTCPGSPAATASGAASQNAWARLSASVDMSCSALRSEMLARVSAEAEGAWTDPHNHGVYTTVDDSRDDVLAFLRLTGDGLFTDALTFALYQNDQNEDACNIYGCSESQGFARADFSTNYCNLLNLFCGTADGCTPVETDGTTNQTAVVLSAMAKADATMCFYGVNVGKFRYCGIASPKDYALPEKQACLAGLKGKPAPTTSSEEADDEDDEDDETDDEDDE